MHRCRPLCRCVLQRYEIWNLLMRFFVQSPSRDCERFVIFLDWFFPLKSQYQLIEYYSVHSNFTRKVALTVGFSLALSYLKKSNRLKNVYSILSSHHCLSEDVWLKTNVIHAVCTQLPVQLAKKFGRRVRECLGWRNDLFFFLFIVQGWPRGVPLYEP